MTRITVTSTPLPADAKALSKGIQSFNATTLPNLEPATAELAFYALSHHEGRLTGGLRATCYWNTLHIELLWLDASTRGQGIGGELLARAEDHARAHDYALAHVETTSWQARPFYERHGYTLLATLDDRPKGYSTHYLSKTLTKSP